MEAPTRFQCRSRVLSGRQSAPPTPRSDPDAPHTSDQCRLLAGGWTRMRFRHLPPRAVGGKASGGSGHADAGRGRLCHTLHHLIFSRFQAVLPNTRHLRTGPKQQRGGGPGVWTAGSQGHPNSPETGPHSADQMHNSGRKKRGRRARRKLPPRLRVLLPGFMYGLQDLKTPPSAPRTSIRDRVDARCVALPAPFLREAAPGSRLNLSSCHGCILGAGAVHSRPHSSINAAQAPSATANQAVCGRTRAWEPETSWQSCRGGVVLEASGHWVPHGSFASSFDVLLVEQQQPGVSHQNRSIGGTLERPGSVPWRGKHVLSSYRP